MYSINTQIAPATLRGSGGTDYSTGPYGRFNIGGHFEFDRMRNDTDILFGGSEPPNDEELSNDSRTCRKCGDSFVPNEEVPEGHILDVCEPCFRAAIDEIAGEEED